MLALNRLRIPFSQGNIAQFELLMNRRQCTGDIEIIIHGIGEGFGELSRSQLKFFRACCTNGLD